MASHASKRARGDRSRISTAVLVNELDQNDAQSAVERELVLRLASLLWRFVGAFLFFPQRRHDTRIRGRKKAVTRPLTSACRTGRPPFS